MNPKQQKFVARFLMHGNATLAYHEAGYKAKPEAARRNASRLLTKADIEEYIRNLQKELAEEAKIKQEHIINVLKAIIFADIGDYLQVTPAGLRFRQINEMDQEKRIAIANATDAGLKLYDKIEAIRELNRMLGFYSKNEQSDEATPVYRVNIHNIASTPRTK